MARVATVAVALGSNLGDRTAHLDYAVRRLSTLLAGLRVSTYRETEPVGVPGPQPAFLNAAAVGETERSPRDLLQALLGIEAERFRLRPFAGAPRTLDLDLILFDDSIVSEADLTVPHPRFRERLFVLGPLAELARDMVDPVTGKTVGGLLQQLTGQKMRI